MAKYHDGGPAFPVEQEDEDGMSLRDWFAGQSIMGMYASLPHDHAPATRREAAAIAYDMAEEMIAERRHRIRLDRQGERSNG